MAATTSPITTDKTENHHRTCRPASQTTKNKQYIYIFPPEGVPVSIKQEQKTAIEIYEGTARVEAHTGSTVANKRKTQ
jgi:hypothetical protein